MTITTTERNGKEYFTVKNGSATYGFFDKAKAEAMLTRLQQPKASTHHSAPLARPAMQRYRREGWEL